MENPARKCRCGKPVTSDAFIGESYFCDNCWALKIQMLQMYKIAKYPSIDEIIENLYVGNEDASSSKEVLREKKITHILAVGDGLQFYFPDDYVYKNINVEDSPSQDIKQHFDECLKFIHSALKEGGIILVHCAAGISRSSTVAIAYLMAWNSWSFEEAYQYAKSKRAIVCPNAGFRSQLKQFEEELKSRPFRFEN